MGNTIGHETSLCTKWCASQQELMMLWAESREAGVKLWALLAAFSEDKEIVKSRG